MGELLALEWRDINLATGTISIRASKTAAGVRAIDLHDDLRAILVDWKLSTIHSAGGDLVFPTGTGRADNRNNVRRRVLGRAVARANERIAEHGGCDPLPAGLSPHGLRRTFASWLIFSGADVAYVMDQLGHADPKMTLGIYAKALKAKHGSPARPTPSPPKWAAIEFKENAGAASRGSAWNDAARLCSEDSFSPT